MISRLNSSSLTLRHVPLFGRTLRARVFGAQAGQRWLFRRNRGWLGGERLLDGVVLWICFAFVLLGIALLTNQGQSALSLTSPARWPTTSAHIVSLQIDERRADHAIEWLPKVAYRYRVGNRQYESSRVSLSQVRWTSRAEANAFFARYVSRIDTLAHYNPLQPGEAYLEEPNRLLETTTIVGALLIGGAAVTMAIYMRLR